jgi:hypothetical protein
MTFKSPEVTENSSSRRVGASSASFRKGVGLHFSVTGAMGSRGRFRRGHRARRGMVRGAPTIAARLCQPAKIDHLLTHLGGGGNY